jgi:hypothetical protein
MGWVRRLLGRKERVSEVPVCRSCGHPLDPAWHDVDLNCSPAPGFKPVRISDLPDRYPRRAAGGDDD